MRVVQSTVGAFVSGVHQQQERAAARREQARRERLEIEQAERARLVARQRAREHRRRREREFERTFIASYEAQKGCDDWQSERHMVECVNHRMRAKSAYRAEFFGERQVGPAYIEADGT